MFHTAAVWLSTSLNLYWLKSKSGQSHTIQFKTYTKTSYGNRNHSETRWPLQPPRYTKKKENFRQNTKQFIILEVRIIFWCLRQAWNAWSTSEKQCANLLLNWISPSPPILFSILYHCAPSLNSRPHNITIPKWHECFDPFAVNPCRHSPCARWRRQTPQRRRLDGQVAGRSVRLGSPGGKRWANGGWNPGAEV